MNKNLTIRQQLLLAAVDRNFVVSPELADLSREANAAIDDQAAQAYNYSWVFLPAVNIAARVDEVLAARRDVCPHCKGDTTDVRIGFNCCHCGGN